MLEPPIYITTVSASGSLVVSECPVTKATEEDTERWVSGIFVNAAGVTAPRVLLKFAPILVAGRVRTPLAEINDLTALGKFLGFDVVGLTGVEGQLPMLFSKRESRLAFSRRSGRINRTSESTGPSERPRALRRMLKKFLGKLSAKESRPAPRLPDGMRLYAIGDIHGRLDLLGALAERITSDLASAAHLDVGAIFLGDYVDRGAHSAGVIDLLSSGRFPVSHVALRGNHEEIMLKFLDDENVLDSWRKFGGLETLHSYGVPVAEAMRGGGYDRAREALLRELPQSHLDFLHATTPSIAFGDYFFAHAGVRPGAPLDRQVPEDLLWIREDFLRHEGSFGKIVVHGHTPVERPDERPNRINIDTGAYASGRLTALVLEGETRRFLSTA